MEERKKPQVQGSQHIKEELEKFKLEMEAAKRKGDWQQMSEIAVRQNSRSSRRS